MIFFVNLIVLEAATEGVPRNEVFLKLLQDSQENTFTSLFFNNSVKGVFL